MDLRRLLLILTLLATAGLRAAWEQVTLFDWVYPGEPAYAALQSGAQQSGSKHWLVARLARGEKLPQASARDLASELMDDPNVDAQTKAVLKEKLSSEASALGVGEQSGALKSAETMAQQLDRASKRMDEIALTYKTNVYGKSSKPSMSMDAYNTLQLDNVGGRLGNPSAGSMTSPMQRRSKSFMLGGVKYNMSAAIDNVTVTLGLGLRYDAGESMDLNSSRQAPYFIIGAGFLIPLDNGGLQVHLGEDYPVFISPLMLADINQEGREAFFIDFNNPYRPTPVVKLLDLAYPASPHGYHALAINKQGQSWYWPFNRSVFVYTPIDNNYFDSWNDAIYVTALRVDRDINSNSWMDPGFYYGAVIKSDSDTDALRATNRSVLPHQGVETYGAGAEIHLLTGTQLKADFASSNFSRELSVNGPRRVNSDIAYVATLVQPVGPLNFAFEYGAAGPYYLSSPQGGAHAQSAAMVDTLTSDAVATPSTVTKSYFPTGTGSTWMTFIKDPAVLSNNTSRMVAKAEWNAGWVALGVYEGMISQTNPSDAHVVINPALEGRSDNGYGWFRLFGQTYAGVASPPAASTGVTGYDAQQNFNFMTKGTAKWGPAAGNTVGVNWEEISQVSYREVFFSTWLTQNGVGDNNLLTPSAKVINYGGARATFDIAALLLRTLPSKLTVIGELRDLALQGGVPSVDASNLFSQNYGFAVYEHGITSALNVLGRVAYETWKSNRTFYPLDMQTTEYGLGFDWRLDPILTSLQLNCRGNYMVFDDLAFPNRNFSLTSFSVGTTLSF